MGPPKDASLGRIEQKNMLLKDGKKPRRKNKSELDKIETTKGQVDSLGTEFDILNPEEHEVVDG